MKPVLPPGTRIGGVTLTVADLQRSADFYRGLAGLREMPGKAGTLTLGAGSEALVHLIEQPGARPSARRASGLFHTAILYPDRPALARTIRHIVTQGYPFTGASDHIVSEAFYLDDPDGHGVELYCDRPRSSWQWQDGRIQMATYALDVQDVLREADRPFDGAPEGTSVGHIHLKVGDIDEAERFYGERVGFDVTAHYGDAATFMSAAGYHHHLGANVWQSKGLPASTPEHARLIAFEVVVPGAAPESLQDPWGTRVEIRGVG
jgi:catechol 2,3-dioxygenase